MSDQSASTGSHPQGSERLTELWHDHASRVLAYASRHVDAHSAQEVVAETFLVAWRRIGDVPQEALPWLLVVARNTISNQVRSAVRRRSAEDEIAQVMRAMPAHDGADVTVTERDAVIRGLQSLSGADREVLLLAGWDGLAPEDAAQVLGCTQAAYRARLSRARRRFDQAAAPLGAPAAKSVAGLIRRSR